MAAQSGTVLGAGTVIALHSLWVIPQFVQRNPTLAHCARRPGLQVHRRQIACAPLSGSGRALSDSPTPKLLHCRNGSFSRALVRTARRFTTGKRSSEMEMMLNPWTFGLEAVQQGWQAQSALAFSLMRSFAGGVPKQTTSSPLIPDTVPDSQKEVVAIGHARDAPAAIINGQEAPAALAHARRRKRPKILRTSKKTSRVKARSASKRAAAASQKSSRKAVRRSARKPR
jgi:hypothetical protein